MRVTTKHPLLWFVLLISFASFSSADAACRPEDVFTYETWQRVLSAKMLCADPTNVLCTEETKKWANLYDLYYLPLCEKFAELDRQQLESEREMLRRHRLELLEEQNALNAGMLGILGGMMLNQQLQDRRR